MENVMVRRRQRSGLAGPFGLGGAALGGIITGIATGNPLPGIQMGQQLGSIIGGVARPGDKASDVDKINAIGGAGAGIAGTASQMGSANGAPNLDGGAQTQLPASHNPFLRRRYGYGGIA